VSSFFDVVQLRFLRPEVVAQSSQYLSRRANDTHSALCLHPPTPTSAICTLPQCKHVFHTACLESWYSQSASGSGQERVRSASVEGCSCPVCRRSSSWSLGREVRVSG
jgi:hypothetical protein